VLCTRDSAAFRFRLPRYKIANLSAQAKQPKQLVIQTSTAIEDAALRNLLVSSGHLTVGGLLVQAYRLPELPSESRAVGRTFSRTLE